MSGECKFQAPESDIRPTPRERLDVARRLRVIGSEPQGSRMLCDVVNVVSGDWRSSTVDFALALADLIDPTCHVGNYCDGVVECESCGAVSSEWMDGGKKPVYCPMCDSRIEWEDK